VLALAACGDNSVGEDRLGGDTTVDDRSINAFTHPAANLDAQSRMTFQAGIGPFDFRWEIPQLGPQSTTTRASAATRATGAADRRSAPTAR